MVASSSPSPAPSPSPSHAPHPAFRLAEKHFKNRATWALPALRGLPADLCGPVLDLSRSESLANDEVYAAGWWGEVYAPPQAGDRQRQKKANGKGKERARGERPDLDAALPKVVLSDGRVVYVVAEGCVLIPNYLSAATQTDLLLSALAEYTLPPNPLSLSTHYALPDDLFGLYASAPDTPIRPKHADFDEQQRTAHAEADRANRGPRALIETAPAATLGYDEVKRRNAAWSGDTVSLRVLERTAAQLMRDVRWANLGWVYQWSTKSYDFSTDEPIPFPAGLKETCKGVVAAVPWGEVYAATNTAEEHIPQWKNWADDYEPDTGIVNYYQVNDTLMAHVDRSELDPARPLVSISLGHACVFLLGTNTRGAAPIPLVLRSGDVFVMSGRGRQSYHGVPRIMEDTLPEHFAEQPGDSEQMRAAKRWVQTARVNINARQVFPPKFRLPQTQAVS